MKTITNGALYFAPTALDQNEVAAFLSQGRYVPQKFAFKAPASIEVDDYLHAIAQAAGTTLYRASAIFMYLPFGLKGIAALRALKFVAALSLIAETTGAEFRVVNCSELVATNDTDWQSCVPDDVDISFEYEPGLDLLDLEPVGATTLAAVHQASQRIGPNRYGDTMRAFDPRAWRNRRVRVSKMIGAALLRTARAA